jgi:LEA14-like dessication related protein
MTAVTAVIACEPFQKPILQVQTVGRGRVGLTGTTLHVEFAIRNPNREAISIERIEYELDVNGHSLGRGFVPNPVSIAGFASERTSSDLDVSYLRVPAVVKDLLNGGRTRAHVSGHYFLRRREGASLDRMGFSGDADLDLRQP